MSDEPIQFHMIYRRDLKGGGDPYSRWFDPDQIAPISSPNLQAILDNPAAGDDEEPVQIIATRTNRVVGRIDMIPTSMRVGGQLIQVFWGSNLYVPRQFRNTLTGVLLIMKAQSFHHTVGASGPSQAALPVYQKLKWTDRPLTRYILVLRSRAVVQRYAGEGPHSSVGSVLVDGLLWMHRGLLVNPWTMLITRGLRAQRYDSMPQEMDAMLATRGHSPVAMHRSAKVVNWWLTHAFKNDPRNANDLFLVQDSGGKTVAYFINKIRFHASATPREFKNLLLGSLQDWMIFDPTAIDFRTIVLLAIKILARRRVDAIELCTDGPSLGNSLRLMGFLKVGAMHMVLKWTPASPLSTAAFSDISKWWIRPGDGDNFFV